MLKGGAIRRTMLQAKLHGATVTRCDLHYEGSCGIDARLLEAAVLLRHQYIEIYNVTNGERFTTYIIAAPHDSGEISLNGAAARKAAIGDKLIICAYADYGERELEDYAPKIVLVGQGYHARITDRSCNRYAQSWRHSWRQIN
jgi:aspartate 1-decarboxylase